MKGRYIAVRAGLPLAFFTIAAGAHAIVAFSNFGPDDSFDTGIGWTISGPDSVPGEFDQGEQFEAGASGSLHSIRLALQHVQGHNNFVVALHEDDSDTVGALITLWSGDGLGAFGSDSILTLTNGFPSISLTAGEKYWVIAGAAGDGWSAWMFNSIGDSGNHAATVDGGANYDYSLNTRGAFEVNVVPEPASMGAILAGLAGLAARRKRR